MHWQGGAQLPELRARAALYGEVRAFFAARGVLEVETPLLCSAGITEPAIEPLRVERGQSISAPRYLQTSPEYAMKRLLAAGSGPIFQIARAFRDGEAGSRHNPEFSLLEWYRPGFGLATLMDEVAALLRRCLGDAPTRVISYRDLFLETLAIDPFDTDIDLLRQRAAEVVDIGTLSGDRDLWLDLLLSHAIEPTLRNRGVCFVHDYPASQAALARIHSPDGVPVAQRFEVYVDGIELANGYLELSDPGEQRARFRADNARRREHGLPEYPLDEYLLAALEAGLPDCSGVALGLDRLLMLRTGKRDIRQVLAFDWARC